MYATELAPLNMTKGGEPPNGPIPDWYVRRASLAATFGPKDPRCAQLGQQVNLTCLADTDPDRMLACVEWCPVWLTQH